MNKTFRSLYGQVAFMWLSGLPCLLFPNVILGIFGVEPTQEIWIRVLGLLVLVMSVFYLVIIDENHARFARLTVYERTAFVIGFTVIILTMTDKSILLLFPATEMLLTLWTATEVKKIRQ